MPDLSQKAERHNLTLNCVHEFSWGFGIAFHTTYALVPLFLKQLGAPTGVVVSVAGLFSILIAIPQLLSAVLGRNIRNLKTAVIGFHMLVLPPVFVMGFTFAFFAPTGPHAWIFYYICFILYGLAVGFIIPIWAGFLHQATNRNSRGFFFGVSFAFNSIGGFIGGFLVKRLLDSSIPFPNNFGWGFLFMFLSLSLGTLMFLNFRLKKTEDLQPEKSVSQFLTETRDIIRTHLNFRRYLLARIFLTANFPAISIYAVHAQDKFGFEVSAAGIFTVFNVVSFGLASYLAGKIGDRFGHKLAIIISFSAHLLAIIVALSAKSMLGVYGIFIFLGFGLGAFMPSSMNLVYDFAGTRDNKIYMALIDTALAPFTFLAIILAGGLSQAVDTEWLLVGIAVLLIIGLLLLALIVKDPKHSPHEPPLPTAV